MDKNTIAEGNAAIDFFMGGNGFLGKEYEEHYSDEFYQPTTRQYGIDDLEYHTSWDWLMPVVEKIEEHGFVVEHVHSCGRNEVRINYEVGDFTAIVSHNDYKPKISVFYDVVVEFVKWYASKTEPIGDEGSRAKK